jgi:hypothetical protein
MPRAHVVPCHAPHVHGGDRGALLRRLADMVALGCRPPRALRNQRDGSVVRQAQESAFVVERATFIYALPPSTCNRSHRSPLLPMTIEDAACGSCRAPRRVMPRAATGHSEPFASLRVNAARNRRRSRPTPRAARGDHAGCAQGIGISLASRLLSKMR